MVYLFYEKPRGLDISLRMKREYMTSEGSYGYALTSKRALRNMLDGVVPTGLSFLDIGCGKGGVVINAHALGFAISHGIEVEPSLQEVAETNIKRLGLNQPCRALCVDARRFGGYASYDVFFMFNPFTAGIYAETIMTLTSQLRAGAQDRNRFLICYGDTNVGAIAKTGCYKLIKEALCPYRGNRFRIYSYVNGKINNA